MEKSGFFHSVRLDESKCMGCTNCIKRCPTGAIRVRRGKAYIISERCIDCGECIRICPHHAKYAEKYSFDELQKYKYRIALPAPTLYGQFNNLDDTDYVLTALKKLGFDDVFEVSKGAEIVSEATRAELSHSGRKKPIISSACPAVVRLIRVRFPNLIENVLDFNPPMEEAARLARERAVKRTGYSKSDIGIFFITPCTAKITAIKQPICNNGSNVDGVFGIKDIYPSLLHEMENTDKTELLRDSGIIGVSWASSGGEASALLTDRYLAADGIENVIRVLDSIENGNISGVDFIELLACAGGCVGGVLTVEDPYIAKGRLQTLRRYMPVTRNHLPPGTGPVPEECLTVRADAFRSVSALNESRRESIRMMMEIERILQELPSLDCGSCGAPTCRAFAEDVVLGRTDINECIFRMRERLKQLMEEHSRPEEPGV